MLSNSSPLATRPILKGVEEGKNANRTIKQIVVFRQFLMKINLIFAIKKIL